MRISLNFLCVVRSYVDRLESIRIVVWCALFLSLGAQLAFQITLLRFVPGRLWFWSGFQVIAFLCFSAQLRKRRSLHWRAARLLDSLREPGVLFVSRWIESLFKFQEFNSLITWSIILAFVSYPFFGDSLRHPLFGYFSRVIEQANTNSYSSLWQVHATILGVFLVLLTFVFQFINLRSAYETSLLPYLASKARLALIIEINFLFLVVEMFSTFLRRQSNLLLPAKHLAVIGFMFSVLSACYLLRRVLEFLKPEMLELGLGNLVRQNLIDEFEEEQFLGAAAHLLAQECSLNMIEFSNMDLYNHVPPIRSGLAGTIVDVDLHCLKKFAKHLEKPLGLAGAAGARALILRTIGDEITTTHNILGRVASSGLNARSEKLLRQSFKVEQV
jgi:hypothetical protein